MDPVDPPPTLPPSCREKFVPLKSLGSGGFGAVILARQQSLGRLAVIKLLRPETMNEDSRIRFDREARAMAGLSHPNLVTVFDYDCTGPEPWLALEYLENESLDRLIDVQPLDVHEALRLGLQMTSALAELHKHGILHRDIKPANILRTAEATYKLGDLGIAHFTNQLGLTQTGFIVGTPSFMSPEAFDGQHSERSDIYALGVTLLCALRGNAAAKVQRDQRERLFLDPPPIPEPMAKILRCCLETEPGERPHSAGALERSLCEIDAAGEPDDARMRGRRPESHTGFPAWHFFGICFTFILIATIVWYGRSTHPSWAEVARRRAAKDPSAIPMGMGLIAPATSPGLPDAPTLTWLISALGNELKTAPGGTPDFKQLVKKYELLVLTTLRVDMPQTAQLALFRRLPELAWAASQFRPPDPSPMDRTLQELCKTHQDQWFVWFLQGAWIRTRLEHGFGGKVGDGLRWLIEARRLHQLGGGSSAATSSHAWEVARVLEASLIAEKPPNAPGTRRDRAAWLDELSTHILDSPDLPPCPALFPVSVEEAIGDVQALHYDLKAAELSNSGVLGPRGSMAGLRTRVRRALRHLGNALIVMAVWDLAMAQELDMAKAIWFPQNWQRRYGIEALVTEFGEALAAYRSRRSGHWLATFGHATLQPQWEDMSAGYFRVLFSIDPILVRLDAAHDHLTSVLLIAMLSDAQRHGDRALARAILARADVLSRRTPTVSPVFAEARAWVASSLARTPR
jgi:serine/threonine protein kinase